MKNLYLQQDYGQKLDSTFLRYRGEIYWCRVNQILDDQGRERTMCCLSAPHDTNTCIHKVSPVDPDLDISSIRLGFLNSAEHRRAFYVRREPFRRVKQGVSLTNIFSLSVDVCGNVSHADNAVMFTSGISESLSGRYPALGTAIEMLKSKTRKWVSVAISPDLCLSSNGGDLNTFFVNFKGADVIGMYSVQTNTVTVPPSPMAHLTSHVIAQQPWNVI